MFSKPLLLIAALLHTCYTDLSSPQVTTSRGKVIGLSVDHSHITGVRYHAFLGLPYAEQPQRFQLAKPKASWSGELIAQQNGLACPQPTSIPSSENCLFLNVFTPEDATAASKLPVMVYLHGSAFVYSSGSFKRYGPDFLVSRGVIFVAINYRLGAPGFLTLGTREAPGNLGLHDSLLALQWVQDEISAFGGDPTQITLFGQSAGAAMTLFHYLSPISAGVGKFFHRAIAQSGSALADWAHYTREEGVRRAKLLAKAVNCDDAPDVLKCLQAVDIKMLTNHTYIPLEDEFNTPGMTLPFIPVLDDASWSDSPFFNDSLHNLVGLAAKRQIPLITGFVAQDGIVVIDRKEEWKQAKGKLATFISRETIEQLTVEKRISLAKEIEQHYFSDSSANEIEDLVRLYTDYAYAFPVIKVAHYFSTFTYGYIFVYNGSWTSQNAYFSQFNVPGVGHGAELPYLFLGIGNQTFEQSEENASNLRVNSFIAQSWTDFAKTGVPSSDWETVSKGNYLVIDSCPCLLPAIMVDTKYYDFWAQLNENAKSPVHFLSKVFSMVPGFTNEMFNSPYY